ncbi:hypothetical protein Trydic_g877 [Trypoxylus dichotomus]
MSLDNNANLTTAYSASRVINKLGRAVFECPPYNSDQGCFKSLAVMYSYFRKEHENLGIARSTEVKREEITKIDVHVVPPDLCSSKLQHTCKNLTFEISYYNTMEELLKN